MNYIKIDNGSTVGHPQILENLQSQYLNFLDRYQELGYLPCAVIDPPEVTDPYIKLIPQYTVDEAQVTMSYSQVPMTAEEKTAYINYRKETDTAIGGWLFNEVNCRYEAPIPYPEDGNLYQWDEETTNWVIQPTE